LINSLIEVTAYDSNTKLFTYKNIKGELSGCEKLFVDINGSLDPITDLYIPGNGWPDQNLVNKVGARTPRIKFTQQSGPAPFIDKFYYDTETYISNTQSELYILDPNADFPQYAYSYHGAFNESTSPWYFAPGDTSEALQDLWGMYSYSQWVASSWRNGSQGYRNTYAGWSPPFKDESYSTAVGPELTSLGVQYGLQAQLQNGNCGATCNGGTDTPALFCSQEWRPTTVNQFNFSII
jgi:hypothetical protein